MALMASASSEAEHWTDPIGISGERGSIGTASSESAENAGDRASFQIMEIDFSSEGHLRLKAPRDGDSYYILYQSPRVTDQGRPIRMKIGDGETVDLTDSETGSKTAVSFYRIRRVPMNASLDIDGDGINDTFELRHRDLLDPLDPKDAANDPDGDGRSNLEEFEQGSDPLMAELPSLPAVYYDAPERLPVGEHPTALAAGDLNGDGLTDLVTANRNSNDVSLLFGKANNTFTPEKRLSTGETPRAVTIADLDHDGKADMATANAFDDSISVLFGKTGEEFADPTDYEVGETPKALAAADLTNDGRPELITANSGSDDISVLVNLGNQKFAEQERFTVGNAPNAVAVEDVDDDNWLDVVTSNSESDSVSVLLGGNDPILSSSAEVDDGSGQWTPQDVALGDVTGDGDVDLVIARRNETLVIEGEGDGRFSGASRRSLDIPAIALQLSDVNEDGIKDILALTEEVTDLQTGVTLALSQGDGRFSVRSSLDVGADPIALAWADLGESKERHLITANGSGNNLSIVRHLGEGLFRAKERFPVSKIDTLSSAAAADLNNDAAVDIVAASGDGTAVFVLLNRGDGHLTAPKRFAASADHTMTATALTVGDLNQDGDVDAVTLNQPFLDGEGSVTIWINQGDGDLVPEQPLTVGETPSSLKLADLDGDDHLDIVTANSESGDVSVLTGDGNGGFAEEQRFAVGNQPESVALGDVNGDNRTDIVTNNSDSPVLINQGDGSFAPAQETDFFVIQSGVLQLADLDHDGHLDLINRHGFSSKIVIFPGHGDGTFGEAYDVSLGDDPGFASFTGAVAVQDVNGDQNPDIVASSDQTDHVSVLLGKGDGTFPSQERFHTGHGPVDLAITDINADTQPDIVAANKWDGNISILRKRPPTIGETPGHVLEETLDYSQTMQEKLQDGETTADVTQWIQQQPDVVEADRDGEMIRYRLSNGTPAYVYNQPLSSTQPQGTGADSSNLRPAGRSGPITPQAVVRTEQRGPGSEAKKALILAPMHFTFKLNGASEASEVAQILGNTRGYEGNVTLKKNEEATRDWFASMSRFDVAHVVTHGETMELERGNQTLQQTVITTGEGMAAESFASPDPEDPRFNTPGVVPITFQDLPPFVGLTPEFFSSNSGSFDRTLVYFSACDTVGVEANVVEPIHPFQDNGKMSSTVHGGENVYFGWNTPVHDDDAGRVAGKLYRNAMQSALPVEEIWRHGNFTDQFRLTASLVAIKPRQTDPGGSGLRLRETVQLLHPVTEEELERGDQLPVQGVMEDGEPDELPIMIRLSGVKNENRDDYAVEISVKGERFGKRSKTVTFQNADETELIETFTLNDVTSHTSELRSSVDLNSDIRQGEEVTLEAEAVLPEGGKTHHKMSRASNFKQPLVVTLENPELRMSSYIYNDHPGPGFAESNVSADVKLRFKRFEEDANKLVFEGEGRRTLEFGDWRVRTDQGVEEVDIPGVCIDNDDQAFLEMLGEVSVPFEGGYTQDGIAKPGEWILAADGCSQDTPDSPVPGGLHITVWSLGMQLLHGNHDQAHPDEDKFNNLVSLPPDWYEVAFRIEESDWTDSGKAVWFRSEQVGDSLIEEETTLEFVFPEGGDD